MEKFAIVVKSNGMLTADWYMSCDGKELAVSTRLEHAKKFNTKEDALLELQRHYDLIVTKMYNKCCVIEL